MSKNTNLHRAIRAKNDEFYTQLSDIENELKHYKQYFSKNACPAYQVASKYMRGTPIRQDYLETAIKWIAERDGVEIEDYMSEHQHDTNASELWLYFQSVISWVQTIFPKYRKEMQGLEWGLLYNKYGKNPQDPSALEEMEVDHITPWCEGGKTEISNGQMLCREHNRRKSNN